MAKPRTARFQHPAISLAVNGKPYSHRGDGTLAALLAELGLTGKPLAVLVNDQVVGARRRRSLKLRDGDRVEMLTFAGGG